MSWYDDFETRVSQAGQTALQDVDTYLIASATNTAVRVSATAQGGNLTAAQIAAGQFGGALAQAAPSATPQQIQNAIQASQVSPMKNMGAYLPWVLAAAVAYVLLTKTAKGK